MVARLPLIPVGRLLVAAGGMLLAMVLGVLVGLNPVRGLSAVLALAYLPIVLINLPLGLALWVVLVFLAGLPATGLAGTLAGLLVLGAWLGTITYRRAALRYALYRHRWLLTAMLLFVAWAALSIAWAEFPSSTLPQLPQYALALVVFLVVATTATAPRHLALVFGGFVAGAVLIVLVGFAQGGLRPAPATIEAADGYGGRLATGGTDPNYLAAGLVPAMALAAGLMAMTRDPIKRLGLILAIAVCALGLATTQSRGGLLAAAIALLVALVVARGRRMQVAALAAVLLAAIGAWLAVDPSFLERLTSSGDGGTGRTELWSVAWQMSGESPLIGVGLQQFEERAGDYARQTGSLEFGEFLTEKPKVVHNAYLQMLAETGAIGLLLYLGVLAAALRATWVGVKRMALAGEQRLADLGRALLVAQVAMLTASLFLSNAPDRRIWILLALGPALMTAAARIGAPEPASSRRRRRGPAGLLPAFRGPGGTIRARRPARPLPALPSRGLALPAAAPVAFASPPPPPPLAPPRAPAPPPAGAGSGARRLPPPPERRRPWDDVTLEGALLRAPAFMVVVLAVLLAAMAGGFRGTTWYAAALFVLALLVVVLAAAAPRRVELDRPFALVLAAFSAYAAWSYLSISWAETPADAWDGANRTLFYLCAVALVGLRRWTAGLGRVVLMIVAFGVTLLGIRALAGMGGDGALELFIGGRLSEPTGYANGNGALWIIALWPALHLAVNRELPAPVRGLALGCAPVLLGLAVLTQSRGAVIGLAASAALFLVLHPRRWPALAALATAGAGVALIFGQLVDVRLADSSEDLIARATAARDGIAVVALGTVLLGTLVAAAARRLWGQGGVPATARRAGDRVFLGLAALLAVAAVGVTAANGPWLDARWQEFRSASYEGVEDEQTRFTGSLGSGRYDYYRVAVRAFQREPLRGIGADSFSVEYLRERQLIEAPRYAHSILFANLSQLGAIGTLLLGLAFAGLGWGFARVRRRADTAAAGVAVAGLAGGTAWLVHAGADWLWEFPALSLLALSLLVVAARTRPTPRWEHEAAEWTGGSPSSLAQRLLLGAAAIAAVISLALPAASFRTERSAYDVQRQDPATAMARLLRASELNPLNADPLLARAVIARKLRQPDVARTAMAGAAQREPNNWLIWFEMGLLEAQNYRWGRADRAMARAAELNPRQPVVADVRRQIARREPVDPEEAEGRLTEQSERNNRPTEAR